MGISPRVSWATLPASLSTQTTSLPFSARHAPTTSPTYPVPTTAMFRAALPRPEPGQRTTKGARASPAIIRRPMHFGLDVRPALTRPTGVGTYLLGLLERLPRLSPEDHFTYFSASVKDRYPRGRWPGNVRLVDRRLPVRGLNLAWNRLGWPP